jgi:hypothetical protein
MAFILASAFPLESEFIFLNGGGGHESGFDIAGCFVPAGGRHLPAGRNILDWRRPVLGRLRPTFLRARGFLWPAA